MIHYTLMQVAVPQQYMVAFLQACTSKLEYFIDARTLLGEGVHSLNAVDDVFDLANTQEFKTIAIKLNPFKRVVLDYHAINYKIENEPNAPNIAYYLQFSDIKDFNQFVVHHFSDANPDKTPLMNSSPYYFTDKLSVDYLLEFDTIDTDVKQIPEFSGAEVTNYMLDAKLDTENYQSLYNQASIAKVTEVYAADLTKYGYTFE